MLLWGKRHQYDPDNATFQHPETIELYELAHKAFFVCEREPGGRRMETGPSAGSRKEAIGLLECKGRLQTSLSVRIIVRKDS
jgi:hypothetical protein